MNGYIVTDVTFSVANVLRGPVPSPPLTVRGGTVDGETQVGEYSAPLAIGESYYLFAKRVNGAWITGAAGPIRSKPDGTVRLGGENFTPNDVLSLVTNL